MQIRVGFEEKIKSLPVSFTENTKSFDTSIDAYYSKEKAFYQGDYEVTPKAEAQVLPTKDTIMIDNVIINKVPFYETQNDKGGLTVYIASEV